MGTIDVQTKELRDRLDTVGWGLLFLLFGALAGVKIDVFVLFFVLAGGVTIAGAVVQPGRVAVH